MAAMGFVLRNFSGCRTGVIDGTGSRSRGGNLVATMCRYRADELCPAPAPDPRAKGNHGTQVTQRHRHSPKNLRNLTDRLRTVTIHFGRNLSTGLKEVIYGTCSRMGDGAAGAWKERRS